MQLPGLVRATQMVQPDGHRTHVGFSRTGPKMDESFIKLRIDQSHVE